MYIYIYIYKAGDTWADDVDVAHDDGRINAGPVVFFLSYIFINNWNFVQVSVAGSHI
jgi:hypothetical protein